MIRAVLFDCFGVLVGHDGVDPALGDIVKRLRGRVKLGVLSNLGSNTVPELLGPELTACFDEIMVSGQLGVGKPDQRAYLLAAQRMREFAEDCLLIDDSERNVLAARALGWHAIHFTGADLLRRHLKRLQLL